MTLRRITAPVFASILAAGAAGAALLAPADAGAQEGQTIFLIPERGGAGPTGQEYILMLVPRQPSAGQSGPGAQQEGRMGPGATGPMMGQGSMMGQGPAAMHGPMMGQGPAMQGSAAGAHDLVERFAREMFERGYQLGRLEGQGFRGGGQAGTVDLPPRFDEPGVTTFDRPGRFDIFRGPPPGGPDPQQVRQALREAQQALQQGEAQRAEQTLARLDRMLGGETPREADQQRLQQALEDAEQALQRNDRQAAQEALRQARQAIGGREQGEQAELTPTTRGEQAQQGAGQEQEQQQQPTAARAQPQQGQQQQQQGQQ